MDQELNDTIIEYVDFLRIEAFQKLNDLNKNTLEQFLTPSPLAKLMASMFKFNDKHIRILDPGAGVGSLFAACIDEILNKKKNVNEISVTTYEIDALLNTYIHKVLKICKEQCEKKGLKFTSNIIQKDFIDDSANRLGLGNFPIQYFNCIILNPPYGKINVSSRTYTILKRLGLESTNFYSAFLLLSKKFLEFNGEIVSITPRSFCNGVYFKTFRKKFLENMRICRIHLFNSRQSSFPDDKVLQENIIIHSIKNKITNDPIVITSNEKPDDEYTTIKKIQYDKIIWPKDPEGFIHIILDDIDEKIANQILSLNNKLSDLGIDVSTGKVVDFRTVNFLTKELSNKTVPLIYPKNISSKGFVKWPISGFKKPAYIIDCTETKSLLLHNEDYVLTKRFTTNEEKKRIVAAVYDSSMFANQYVGFENKINYYHKNGKGLDLTIAKGLTAYLNTTLVDSFFRQFNGHTQVNATDLRNLYYPSLDQLKKIGKLISSEFPSQDKIDILVQDVLFNMSEEKEKVNFLNTKQKIKEALEIIKELGFPHEQHNERSALTLLSLLNLKPEDSWSKAKAHLIGITPMMNFFREYYGKVYAPNTRETVRRQTIHQFLQANLIVENPDNLNRAINSPDYVYQIEKEALELLKTYKTPEWSKNLQKYKEIVGTLKEKYDAEIKKK